MPATTPSIGEMLLKKEGWLRKEDASVVEVASSNRGGLGFQERTRHCLVGWNKEGARHTE